MFNQGLSLLSPLLIDKPRVRERNLGLTEIIGLMGGAKVTGNHSPSVWSEAGEGLLPLNCHHP